MLLNHMNDHAVKTLLHFPSLSYALHFVMLGSLSNRDDYNSENIAKKMNLHPYKLYHVYLDLINLSKVGDFSWN